MENNYEVFTATDKAKRNQIYQDLKRNGNELERKVVKFSGSQLDPNDPTDRKWFSNWSLAYPRS